MTDIMYVVGDGSKFNDDLPLRWSLRSLAKHVRNVGRVIVAGRPPAWLSDEVVAVPLEQREPGKAWRIFNTVANAAKTLGLSSPFIRCSDDHMFCKDADADLWPHYHTGELHTFRTYFDKHGRMPEEYNLNLIKTRHALELAGLPTRRYCIHAGTWVDPADVDEAVSVAERYGSESVFGLESTCLFNAVHEKKHPEVEWVQGVDCCIQRSVGEIDAALKAGVPVFSTRPEAEVDKKVVARMNEMYAEPCKWEKSVPAES